MNLRIKKKLSKRNNHKHYSDFRIDDNMYIFSRLKRTYCNYLDMDATEKMITYHSSKTIAKFSRPNNKHITGIVMFILTPPNYNSHIVKYDLSIKKHITVTTSEFNTKDKKQMVRILQDK